MKTWTKVTRRNEGSYTIFVSVDGRTEEYHADREHKDRWWIRRAEDPEEGTWKKSLDRGIRWAKLDTRGVTEEKCSGCGGWISEDPTWRHSGFVGFCQSCGGLLALNVPEVVVDELVKFDEPGRGQAEHYFDLFYIDADGARVREQGWLDETGHVVPKED